VEVKIGIQHAPRELVVDTDESADDVQKQLTEALASDGVLAISDAKGRRVVVPAAKIAFVELGGGVSGTVGFR
jgi:hypothetical protein